jgi:peptidoglycan hydrolase-like protein with peptidoglycan-binding domain
MGWTRLLIAGWAALGLAGASIAQDQAPAQRAPDDPLFEPAKLAFERFDDALRREIQRDLVWVAPFNGAALGTFGRLTYNGIKAFERTLGNEPDGILDSEELALLGEQAAAARAKAKFAVVQDRKSGVRIGLSAALLPKRQTTDLGSKWTSADGAVALETAIGTGTAADLPAAYERFLALPNRKVTYKLLRPDFFVITGETGKDSYYVRYAGDATAVRGFTFRYPTARRKEMDRYVIAAANTFEPFPSAAPTAVAGAQTGPAATSPPPARAATAVRLPDGRIALSAAFVAACGGRLGVAGRDAAGRVETAGGVAFLSGGDPPPTLARAPAIAGDKVLAFAFDAAGVPAMAPGTIVSGPSGLMLEAALQAGGAGAALFDRDGAFVGIVIGDPSTARPVNGVLPVARHAIAEAAALGSMPDHRLGAGSVSLAAIARAAAAAIAPATCLN